MSIDTEIPELPKGLTLNRITTLQLFSLGMHCADIASEMLVTRKTVENNAYWARNAIKQRSMIGAAAWLFANGLHPLQCWSEKELARISAKYSTAKVKITRRPAPRKQDLRIPLAEAIGFLRAAQGCGEQVVAMLAESDPLGVYPRALQVLVAAAGERSERMAERIAELARELEKKRESAPGVPVRDETGRTVRVRGLVAYAPVSHQLGQFSKWVPSDDE